MKYGRPRIGGRTNLLGWLMSYADMATVLLAMFIVLSTLSKDQTGVSLYNGTRSFFHASSAFGLPGLSSTSTLPANKPTPSYLSRPRAEDDERHFRAAEQHPVLDGLDGEEEQLHRFLEELRRQFPVECVRGQTGQMVIDLYEPLRKEAPHLDARHDEVFDRVRPLLEREDFRLYLIVWTPTPSSSAWFRAALQARQAADEFAAKAHLPPTVAARLVPLAQPWRYRDIRRPVLSFLIAKAEE